MEIQKSGGYASIVLGCVQLLQILIIFSLVIGLELVPLDFYIPSRRMFAYNSSPINFYAYYILKYIAAILIIFIALALEERIRDDFPKLIRLAVNAMFVCSALYITTMICGFFLDIIMSASNDMSAYRAFHVLYSFLDNAAFNFLGWSFLLYGFAGIKTRKLPQVLAYIIIISGIGFILFFVFEGMQYHIIKAVNIILSVVAFIWLGIHLKRNSEPKK